MELKICKLINRYAPRIPIQYEIPCTYNDALPATAAGQFWWEMVSNCNGLLVLNFSLFLLLTLAVTQFVPWDKAKLVLPMKLKLSLFIKRELFLL